MSSLKELFWQDDIYKNMTFSYSGGIVEDSAIYEEAFEHSESICAENELRFGGCDVAGVKIKIINQNQSFYNTWITLSEKIGDSDELFEWGKFKVHSEKLTDSRSHKEIVAYDEMYDIVNTDIAKWYNGLVFPIPIKAFRTQLFDYLGIAQVEIELPNDDVMLCSTPYFDSLSAGDVLKDICEINACFGKMNRKGIFDYVFLGNEITTEITKAHYREGKLKYEDFTTKRIDGIILIQNDADVEFYYNAEGENLYTISTRALFFGENEEVINGLLKKTFGIMEKVEYVPMSVESIGNPCIECGEKVKIITDEGSIETYILERSSSGIQTLHDSYTADGIKRYIVQQGSSDRVLRSVNNKISNLYRNNFYSYVFSNALEYRIGSKEEFIIEFNVAATTNTDVILLATIPIELDLDGELVLKYYVDAVEVENTEIRQYMHSGKSFVTVSNYFNMGENDRMTLKVSAHMEYRESVERQHTAKILSFEDYISTGTYTEQAIDTTIPGGTIEQWEIKAVLFSKGLAGTASWDGTINIVEEMTAVILNNALSVIPMNDSVSVSAQVPDGASITEEFNAVTFENFITVRGLVDEIAVNSVVVLCSIDTTKQADYTFDRDYVTVEGAYSLTTSYTYYSTEESIDSGYMCSVKIVTSDKASVESVVVE